MLTYETEATPERWKRLHESLGGIGHETKQRIIWELGRAEAALRLYAKYAPMSGDMALMIRANQAGGQEAADHADKLIEHYSHLDEAHDAARVVLAHHAAV